MIKIGAKQDQRLIKIKPKPYLNSQQNTGRRIRPLACCRVTSRTRNIEPNRSRAAASPRPIARASVRPVHAGPRSRARRGAIATVRSRSDGPEATRGAAARANRLGRFDRERAGVVAQSWPLISISTVRFRQNYIYKYSAGLGFNNNDHLSEKKLPTSQSRKIPQKYPKIQKIERSPDLALVLDFEL